MKNLNGLKGVKELSKNTQKSIAGGVSNWPLCFQDMNTGKESCLPGWICVDHHCIKIK